MDRIALNRGFMKSVFGHMPGGISDQSRGVRQPPLQKPCPEDAPRIALPEVTPDLVVKPGLFDCMRDRQSLRHWLKEPLRLEELAFLLWATQGVREVMEGNYATLRTVPSAGARHAFETYIAAHNVEGLEHGVYRYLPLSHELVVHFVPGERRLRGKDRRIGAPDTRSEKEERRSGEPDRRGRDLGICVDAGDMREQLLRATFGQEFAADAPAVFIWSCIPYRSEWRYSIAAHKVTLLDAGHLAQNLYLACEAIGAGTCAIGAYDQEVMDRFLRLDGEEEFAVYLAPVGKVK